MPRRLIILLVTAFALAAPASSPAAVSAPASRLLLVQQGSPLARVESMASTPLGFSASAGQAARAAEQTRTMQALHRRMHPLAVLPFVWRSTHPYWYVVFTYHGTVEAVADVSKAGHITGVWTGPQARAPYAQGHWASVLTSWMILLPASLLFLLPFFDPRRLRRMLHLDALVILSFLVSYLLLSGAHLRAAVWLVYPPLLYLLVRFLLLGLGRARHHGRLAPLLSMRTLLLGLPVLLVARIVLSLLGHQEIDVGYGSVAGAYRITHGLPLYWNDPNHLDTYGPVAYLAYVPFQLLSPWSGGFNHLRAADLAAIVFDLGTVAALVMLGRRLRAGSDGTRLGLLLAWGWAACPFTIIGLVVHTNDALISMLTVFALVAIASPVVSGALLGLAAAAKFSPAALLPLLASPRRRGLKGAALLVGSFVAVVAVAIVAWLPPGGLSYFWQRTIGFQITRADAFSPWGLDPGLHPLQVVLEVLAVLLILGVGLTARERPLWRVCALAAAVTIAIQLPAAHWFYYYIIWFLPFALAALLVPATRRRGEQDVPDEQRFPAVDTEVEAPALVRA